MDSVDASPKKEEESMFCDVKTTKLVCIKYPGFIKNVDNMLATMGGEEKISNTYYDGKCRLQMTFRPEDVNAHFACGDLVPCTGFLMKVRRRKKKTKEAKMDTDLDLEKDASSETQATETVDFQQEIVGILKEQYEFKTLMDYQYLTPQPMWNYFKNIHGSELGQTNFPPYFAPPVFGRIDTCGSYEYRPDPVQGRQSHISKGLSEKFESDTHEHASTARKRRQAESMAALFGNENVPQGPSPGAINIIKNMEKGPDNGAIERVKQLFEERPIWSKLAVSCHLNVNLDKLKKIIQYFAYYWLSGPWRTMWCRMGYDPRKDPKAKVYQMIDFRIRDSKESKKSYRMLIPRRSYKNYIPRNLQPRVLPHHGSSVLAASDEPVDESSEDPVPYIFSPDKMLPSRNMMYQICDLHDAEVQNIVRESDGKETRCDEKEGWFPPGVISKIRAQMAQTVDAYFEREKLKGKQDQEDYEASVKDFSEYDTEEMHMEANDEPEFQPFSYLQMLQETGDGIDPDVHDDYYNDYSEEYYDA